MNETATIKCWQCRKRVTLTFHRVSTPVKEHWQGTCTCGAKNFVYRPSWDQMPIFRIYKREYLSQVTGYSLGHLSRIAKEKTPLKRQFIEHCCHVFGEPEKALFGT